MLILLQIRVLVEWTLAGVDQLRHQPMQIHLEVRKGGIGGHALVQIDRQAFRQHPVGVREEDVDELMGDRGLAGSHPAGGKFHSAALRRPGRHQRPRKFVFLGDEYVKDLVGLVGRGPLQGQERGILGDPAALDEPLLDCANLGVEGAFERALLILADAGIDAGIARLAAGRAVEFEQRAVAMIFVGRRRPAAVALLRHAIHRGCPPGCMHRNNRLCRPPARTQLRLVTSCVRPRRRAGHQLRESGSEGRRTRTPPA